MTAIISTIIRYLTLWLAHVLGRIHWWLNSEWRKPVLWLAVTAFIIWLAEHIFNIQSGTWFDWWKILSIYALFVLLWWAWQARHRVVIEEFVDFTSNQPDSITKGLSTLLLVELARLRRLYSIVDEQRAIPTVVEAYKPIDATIKVEDVSEFLKGAVTTESKFSLGPLEIPVGTFMALIGRLVQGSQIIGSLHKDKDHFILTAQMIGGRQIYSWRVDDPKPIRKPESQGPRDIDDMIAELACRIFTDLTLKGSAIWRATGAFDEGLRAYRNCLRTHKDRKLKLMEAEKNFIKALAEDEKFDLAYYNLGVVYTELDRAESAESSFLKAIEQNPYRWEAYYALALNLFWRKQYGSVIQLCDHIIYLKPDNAKAYGLKGLSQPYLEDLRGAFKSRQKAVAKSWKALCIAELRGKGAAERENSHIPQMRKIARDCLLYLATAYVIQAKKSKQIRRWLAFQSAVSLLRQALYIHPDANLHFRLGRAFHQWGKYNLAVQEYKSAIRADPENPRFWAYLALVCAAQNNKESTQYACEKVLDGASEVPGEDLDKTAEAYGKLGRADQSKRVSGMKAFLEELKDTMEKGESSIPVLEEKLTKYDQVGTEWEYAHVSFALGSSYLNLKPEEAENLFRTAIERFEGKHPKEIRRKELWKLLADSLRKQGKYPEALQVAEHAFRLDPLAPGNRVVLGKIYYALSEFEHARDVWKDALLWSPNDPSIHANIGIYYRELARDCHGIQRDEALRQAISYLNQALNLYTSDQMEGRLWAHYWLGRLYLKLREYEKAIPHVRIIQVQEPMRLIATFYLGWAYLKSKAYNECVDQFDQIIKKVEELLANNASLNENIGTQVRDQISLGKILIDAYLNIAFSYAERDVNLKDALDLTKRAEEYIKKLDCGDVKTRCQAVHADCEGWILYKQDRIDEAIEHFERSVSLIADARAYLHLALAYERKLQGSKDDTQIHSLIASMQACYQHVQELDTDKEYSQAMSDLLQHLQEKSQQEQQMRMQEQK